MGLDILIAVDNMDEVYTPDYHNPVYNHFKSHNLSRSFSNLMFRQHVVNGEPELDQIGRIASVDITPIYEMEQPHAVGNIETVYETVRTLVSTLSEIQDLPALLQNHGNDTLDYRNYFADFNRENEKSYIANNFGQDLRNFLRFLSFARERGATSVFFQYG